MSLVDAFCNSFGLVTTAKWEDIYCPKTEHTKIKPKFLWFGKKEVKVYKKHDYVVDDVRYWEFNEYEITIKCKDCGNTIRRFGLSKSKLLHAGVDVDAWLNK